MENRTTEAFQRLKCIKESLDQNILFTCIGKTRSNAIDNSFGVREVPTIPSRKSALTHWAQ